MSERTIVFGDGLVGTLTLPQQSTDFGLLCLNAGVVHRVGPHRINVRLARQLGARGIASIRFDLAGHGDSARPSGARSFEEQAVVDIRAAMDALGAAAAVERFALFGYCSGAYYGYAAALADERLRALLMYDAYRYPTWKTHTIRALTRLAQPHATRALVGAARRKVTALTSRRREAPKSQPQLGRIDFIPSRSDFARGLRTLVDRGVAIHMIYSGGELREYNYRGQFRDNFPELADRIQAEFLPDLDHVASGVRDQAELMQRVLDWSSRL